MSYRHGAIGLAKKAAAAARKAKRAVDHATEESDAVKPFTLEDFLFDKQLAFVLDPAPFKTGLCSRRAGKSTACAADLIFTALSKPEIVCLYVNLTRALAKKTLWNELRKINARYELGGEENKSELSITFPNGSIVYLSGAGTFDQIEMFRGLALVKVYVDEAQSFRSHLSDLCDTIFGPALMDHDGSLILIGTPSPIPAGYFYQCINNTEWGHHAWTFFDNPKLPFLSFASPKTHQEMLERELRRRGTTEADPAIRREYFGEWKVDEESLFLNYKPDLCDFTELPPGSYEYILGVDMGFHDSDSLSVLAYSQSSACTWLIEEIVTPKQDVDMLANQIRILYERYAFVKMVADTGANGKKIVETYRNRYGWNLEAADKVRKIEHYSFLNSAMRRGLFKAKRESRFAQDTYLLEKDRQHSTPEKTVVKGHSDAVDSALYAFMESPAYYYVAPKAKAKVGSTEFDAEFEEQMFQANVERHAREEQQKNGTQGTDWTTDVNGVPPWLKY